MELGPVLGAAFIGFRVFIVVYLLGRSLHALYAHRDNLPILIWSAFTFPFALSQWAPPTILGFAVVGGGLLLSSLNPDVTDEEEEDSEEEDADPLALEKEPVSVLPARVRY
jgi:hypothetical protein